MLMTVHLRPIPCTIFKHLQTVLQTQQVGLVSLSIFKKPKSCFSQHQEKRTLIHKLTSMEFHLSLCHSFPILGAKFDFYAQYICKLVAFRTPLSERLTVSLANLYGYSFNCISLLFMQAFT